MGESTCAARGLGSRAVTEPSACMMSTPRMSLVATSVFRDCTVSSHSQGDCKGMWQQIQGVRGSWQPSGEWFMAQHACFKERSRGIEATRLVISGFCGQNVTRKLQAIADINDGNADIRSQIPDGNRNSVRVNAGHWPYHWVLVRQARDTGVGHEGAHLCGVSCTK
jgi:hypothetical protein